MFKKLKRASAAHRLLEEQLYKQVVQELAQGQRRDGLWGKALANSNGSKEKAEALYIQYRVQSIKDEIEISKALEEESVRQKGKKLVSKVLEEESVKQKGKKLVSESFTEDEIIKKIARSCKYGSLIKFKKYLETLIERYPKKYIKLKDKELKDVKGLLVECHVCDKVTFKDQTREYMGVRICLYCWNSVKGF
jgi:hypothetical protein